MAVEIFKVFGSIFVNNDEANKSISNTDKKASEVASTLGKGIKSAAKWGAAVVGGATAAAGGLTAMASKSAEVADEVDKMSGKIGLSKQGYQEWKYVLGQNGVEISKMQTGMKTLVSNMKSAESGTESAKERFKQLGISITDSNGKLKGQEEMMSEVLLKLADMPNGTEKARLATELFGKSGVEMMPMLNNGSASIKELTERSHELGLIMSDDAVDAGVKLGDTMDDVKQSLSMVGTKIGTSLFPVIQKVCDAIIEYMPEIQALIGRLEPIFTRFLANILPVLMDLGEKLLPVIMDLIQQLMPIITQLFQALAPIITQITEQLLPSLVSIVEMILPPVMQIITALMPLMTTLLELLIPIVEIILNLAGVLIDSLLTALVPIIEQLSTFLNELIQPLIPVITQMADIIATALAPIFEQLSPVLTKVFDALKPVLNLFGELLSTLIPALVPIIEWLADVFSNVLGVAIDCVSGILDNVTGVFSGLVDFITGVFTGDWDKAWEGIVGVFKGIFNQIPTIVEFIINGAIGLINGLLSGIDWAVEWLGWEIPMIPEVTLPRFRAGIDYVPNDKYMAYLDAGEAVLSAPEAEEYRQAKRQSGGYSPFAPNQTENKTINQNFNISIAVEKMNDNTDIDKLVNIISQKLAAEMKRKEGAYA